VGGGQASNLFTLIAGGDVGLSILCTISTTLLGVVATPFLVSKFLLGSAIGGATATGYYTVVKSISSLILLPIIAGSLTTRLFPNTIEKIAAFLPPLGVLSTLVLVAGGSSTTFVAAKATTMTGVGGAAGVLSAILIPSILLSLMGAVAAWCVTSIPLLHLDERTKKTLVMETLSKSPTLAYVLAIKHFNTGTAGAASTAANANAASMIPAAAMVTLAVIGALVASVWATISNRNNSSSSSSSSTISTSTTE